jgi:hypothetical protein
MSAILKYVQKNFARLYKRILIVQFIVFVPTAFIHLYLLYILPFDEFYHFQCAAFPFGLILASYSVLRSDKLNTSSGKFLFACLLFFTPLDYICLSGDLLECIYYFETGSINHFKIEYVSSFERLFNLFVDHSFCSNTSKSMPIPSENNMPAVDSSEIALEKDLEKIQRLVAEDIDRTHRLTLENLAKSRPASINAIPADRAYYG